MRGYQTERVVPHPHVSFGRDMQPIGPRQNGSRGGAFSDANRLGCRNFDFRHFDRLPHQDGCAFVSMAKPPEQALRLGRLRQCRPFRFSTRQARGFVRRRRRRGGFSSGGPTAKQVAENAPRLCPRLQRGRSSHDVWSFAGSTRRVQMLLSRMRWEQEAVLTQPLQQN